MSSQLGNELKRSKYRLLGLVGQGQFGRVFCAAHRKTGKLVALKALDRQRFPTHKFLRELRFLLSLQHPNIVTCQALEHTATGRYLVMDYCEGGTLRSLMSEENHLNFPQSLKLIADILAGLDHAHSRGIVHCDIKPENILLNVEPDGWTARISDFGIARLSQEMVDQEFGNTGSPAYMAPERFYGQYSLTSDLYSVGILLFELLAGYRPFTGSPADLMSAHLNQPVKLPDSIPEIWQPIIIRSLQKLSARRFRSAGEMLSVLRSIAVTEGSGSWLDPQAIHLPLLRFTETLPIVPLESQNQELLKHPLHALAVVQIQSCLQAHSTTSNSTWADRRLPPSASPVMPEEPSQTSSRLTYLYRAEANQVAVQMFETATLEETDMFGDRMPHEIWHVASYKTPIQALLPRPQGCFVVTQRSLHLIPVGIELDPQLASKTILELDQDFLAAIDPSGHWLATLAPSLGAEEGILKFQQLPQSNSSVTITPDPISIALQRSQQPLQLLALDPAHIAIVLNSAIKKTNQPGNTKGQSSTVIRIMTRRGNYCGSLNLPVQPGPLLLTPTPHQLLATDRNHPEMLLLINLKPYRISRLALGIKPTFWLATVWGYILASSQGQIVFLDREGQQIGRMAVPFKITAIASLGLYKLLVSTWNETHGRLHILDLRESGVELLF